MKDSKFDLPVIVVSILRYIQQSAKGTFKNLVCSEINDRLVEKIKRGFVSQVPVMYGEETHIELMEVLLQYFEQLETPVIPFENYDEILGTFEKEFSVNNPQKLVQILSSIPNKNIEVLNYVSHFLHDFTTRNLTDKNFAIHLAGNIFGPVLMYPSNKNIDWLSQNTNQVSELFKTIITHIDIFFKKPKAGSYYVLPYHISISQNKQGIQSQAVHEEEDDNKGKALGLFDLLDSNEFDSLNMIQNKHFHKTVEIKPKKRASMFTKKVPNITSSTKVEGQVVLKGWITKKKNSKYSKKKKWFILTEQHLAHYRDNKKETPPISVLNVESLAFETVSKHEISLKDHEDSYTLYTQDHIQYSTWVTALQRTKHKLQNKDKFNTFNSKKSGNTINSPIEKKIANNHTIENNYSPKNNHSQPVNSSKDSSNYIKPSIDRLKNYSKSSNRLVSVLMEDN